MNLEEKGFSDLEYLEKLEKQLTYQEVKCK